MSNWFVLWVLTGSEKDVLREALKGPGVDEGIVPIEHLLYRKDGAWEERESVAIPGYVFIRCRMDSAIYYRLRGIPRVIGWLGDGMWPTIVPEHEMLPITNIHKGLDPASQLINVSIDKHKRRGKGTLTLYGKEQTIVFTPRTNKQPDKAQVDQRPATEDGDQSQG